MTGGTQPAEIGQIPEQVRVPLVWDVVVGVGAGGGASASGAVHTEGIAHQTLGAETMSRMFPSSQVIPLADLGVRSDRLRIRRPVMDRAAPGAHEGGTIRRRTGTESSLRHVSVLIRV